MCSSVQLSLPYNGDPRLSDIIVSDFSDSAASMYGSFGLDHFGGGRALPSAHYTSEEILKKVIRKLDSKGIEFNYVLNNTNMLNCEFYPYYKKKYLGFIEKLLGLGVRMVTLCNPHLIEFTKSRLPEMKISASVNFKIRSWLEVKYILDLGCDEITLHYDILKNFNELRKIRKSTNVPLKLIPNDVYIKDCPWQKGHTRMQGGHSRKKAEPTPYFSYYRNKCMNLRNYYPEEICKAMWIAPDQLWRYKEIGYNHYKILDRMAQTEWIIRATKAYLAEKPYLHLERILGTYGRRHTEGLLEPLKDSDPPYPIRKLEYVPQIKSPGLEGVNIVKYWSSEDHPQDCDQCRACYTLFEKTVVYPEKAREIAKKRNYEWQRRITKISFIESLSKTLTQRITYV